MQSFCLYCVHKPMLEFQVKGGEGGEHRDVFGSWIHCTNTIILILAAFSSYWRRKTSQDVCLARRTGVSIVRPPHMKYLATSRGPKCYKYETLFGLGALDWTDIQYFSSIPHVVGTHWHGNKEIIQISTTGIRFGDNIWDFNQWDTPPLPWTCAKNTLIVN